MENELTQREQMIRYGLSAGREILEKLKSEIPKSKIGCLDLDCQMLEQQIGLASRLLEKNGEFSPMTVLAMQGLVHMYSSLSNIYLKRGDFLFVIQGKTMRVSKLLNSLLNRLLFVA
jgi:hypothetical protein